jgi:hypothetical protein
MLQHRQDQSGHGGVAAEASPAISTKIILLAAKHTQRDQRKSHRPIASLQPMT